MSARSFDVFAITFVTGAEYKLSKEILWVCELRIGMKMGPGENGTKSGWGTLMTLSIMC